jgi:hypothetical protein
MPRVGRRQFAYTPAGRKAAKSYARATGQTMTGDKKKKRKKTY